MVGLVHKMQFFWSFLCRLRTTKSTLQISPNADRERDTDVEAVRHQNQGIQRFASFGQMRIAANLFERSANFLSVFARFADLKCASTNLSLKELQIFLCLLLEQETYRPLIKHPENFLPSEYR